MICFLGKSHAVVHLRDAAHIKGLELTEDPDKADLLFVSEDTPTDEHGNRDVAPIRCLIDEALRYGSPIVLTSQVQPGFTRSLGIAPRHIYHQAETLRIKDAVQRSLAPDYIAVGCASYGSYQQLPSEYKKYLGAFNCEVRIVTYEDAEFSKIAVNMFLAAQVDATNRLAAAAAKANASWQHVSEILHLDKRIGPDSYLVPGRWQDSTHLMRDYVTLGEISAS